jgi:hypothetical protein
VLVGKHNVSLAEYRALSLYARYLLHRSVQRYREAVHGTAEEEGSPFNPEDE